MDEYLIIEFSDKISAQAALDSVNAQILQMLQTYGYTVTDGEVIGKNAATGADDPAAVQTSTWDTVKQSPDNTFYFSSPHNDQRLASVMITGGAEKPFPAAWQQTGDV